MNLRCCVCDAAFGAPLYTSPAAISVTSTCAVLPRPTEVHYCERCGHLQTPALDDLAAYYADEYRILAESEDEDQLYEVRDGKQVFRADHQLDTLLAKLDLPSGARVLDYGCAKGATLRRLCARRPDLVPYLYDVTDAYVPFWTRFSRPERWSTTVPPAEWGGTLDVVTSFYSLEHVAEPRATVSSMARLLRPGGVLYAVVPDVQQNIGDFVVADHVNHYTPSSLRRLLEQAGFEVRSIDARAHASALVVVAARAADVTVDATPPPAELRAWADRTATFWRGLGERVRAFERERARRGPAAVYGSGFYGTFLFTCLADPGRVAVFLDQSPFRQGRTLLERPVVAPAALPEDARTLYVGLNPARARAELAKVEALIGQDLEVFYP